MGSKFIIFYAPNLQFIFSQSKKKLFKVDKLGMLCKKNENGIPFFT
jgi:hypothetical protein